MSAAEVEEMELDLQTEEKDSNLSGHRQGDLNSLAKKIDIVERMLRTDLKLMKEISLDTR
jgi:hypothetical protein